MCYKVLNSSSGASSYPTLLEQWIFLKALRFLPELLVPHKTKHGGCRSLPRVTPLWLRGAKAVGALPGCSCLQVLPKAGALRMKGRSSNSCGLQKRTIQCKNAGSTLISFTDIKAEVEELSLGSRVEKSEVTAPRMPCCPGLA